jgi:hypothetical protein
MSSSNETRHIKSAVAKKKLAQPATLQPKKVTKKGAVETSGPVSQTSAIFEGRSQKKRVVPSSPVKVSLGVCEGTSGALSSRPKVTRKAKQSRPEVPEFDMDDSMSDSLDMPDFESSGIGFLEMFGSAGFASATGSVDYVTGLSSQDSSKVLSALEEFNDYLNLSSDDVAFRLPLSRLLPLLMDHLSNTSPIDTRDDPGRRMLLAAQILSSIVDSSPAAADAIAQSSDNISRICSHIREMLYLDLADQCVVILSRMCKEYGTMLLRFGAVGVLLDSIEFFAISTQIQCIGIVADILAAGDIDEKFSTADILGKLCGLLNHPDASIASKVSVCWRRGIDMLCAFDVEYTNVGSLEPILAKLDNEDIVEGLTRLAERFDDVAVWLLQRGLGESYSDPIVRLLCAILPGIVVGDKNWSVQLDESRLAKLGDLNPVLRVLVPELLNRTASMFPLSIPVWLTCLASGYPIDPRLVESLCPSICRVLESKSVAVPSVIYLVGKFVRTYPDFAVVFVRNGVLEGLKSWSKKCRKLIDLIAKSKSKKWGGDIASMTPYELIKFGVLPKMESQSSTEFLAKLVEVVERESSRGPSRLTATPTDLSGRMVRIALVGAQQNATHLMVEPNTPINAMDSVLGEKKFVYSIKGIQLDRSMSFLEAIFSGSKVDEDVRFESFGSPGERIVFDEEEEDDFDDHPAWTDVHVIQYADVAPTEELPHTEPSINMMSSLRIMAQQKYRGDVSGTIDHIVGKVCSSLETVCSTRVPLWVSEIIRFCPWLISLDVRRQVFLVTQCGPSRSISSLLPPIRQKIRVQREHILQSALVAMNMFAPSHGARNPPMIELEFIGEEGTGSGPTNEFFTIVADCLRSRPDLLNNGIFPKVANLTKADWSVFEKSLSERRAAPVGQITQVTATTLELWRLVGLLVGRALLDNRLVDLDFHPLFWKLVLGGGADVGMDYLREIDPQLWNSLSAIRKMSTDEISGIDLTTLPGHPAIKLKTSRSDPAGVFVEQVVKQVLRDGVALQVSAFTCALTEVVGSLSMFEPTEISSLIVGSGNPVHWTIPALKGAIHASHGYNDESRAFVDFLAVVSDLAPEDRGQFIRFITGSKSLPPGGFAGLKPPLTVVKASNGGNPDAYLPSVMTCAHFVKLPEYSSREVMRDRLSTAIKEGQGSFLLS